MHGIEADEDERREKRTFPRERYARRPDARHGEGCRQQASPAADCVTRDNDDGHDAIEQRRSGVTDEAEPEDRCRQSVGGAPKPLWRAAESGFSDRGAPPESVA